MSATKRKISAKSATLKTLRISGISLAPLFIFILSFLLTPPTPALAIDLQVCPSGCPFNTIQAAIDAAVNGDVIKVATGIYAGVQERSAPAGYPGSNVIAQVVYLDKSITIRGGYPADFNDPPDPIANPTTIDAQGQGRALFVAGSVTPVIEGFILKGGNAAGQGGSLNNTTIVDAGGGIYVLAATPVFSANQIVGNTAGDGGGCYLRGSSATFQANTIAHNEADYGGGIFLSASPATLVGNTIRHNQSTWEGGGIYFDQSAATFTANEVDNNLAGSYGGGLSLWQSSATVADNAIHHNQAQYIGGGVSSAFSQLTLTANSVADNLSNYNCGGVAIADSTTTVEGNLIARNQALLGGGLCAERGRGQFNANRIVANASRTAAGGVFMELMDSPTLVNNLVADNRADVLGSGLYFSASTPKLSHTTIARNTGGTGSGIFASEWLGFPSQIVLSNTILVGQSIGVQALLNTVVSLNDTLWGAGIWDNGADTFGPGAINIGSYNLYAEPGFVNPAVGDYHLQANSPAIDQGLDAGVFTDFDGDPRPIGAAPDLGADEFPYGLRLQAQAAPDPVQAGTPMTYTLNVTNNGLFTLTTTITDQLPLQVFPGGTLTWQTILAPGQNWVETVVVTPDVNYVGLLMNHLQATSAEGAAGVHTLTSLASDSLLYTLPGTPVVLEPTNGASEQPLNQTLHWAGSDADGDLLTYTVHLGTIDPPPAVAETTETSYQVTLEPNKTYYWSITAFDGRNQQAGPVWYFSTKSVDSAALSRHIYLPLMSRIP